MASGFVSIIYDTLHHLCTTINNTSTQRLAVGVAPTTLEQRKCTQMYRVTTAPLAHHNNGFKPPCLDGHALNGFICVAVLFCLCVVYLKFAKLECYNLLAMSSA